MEKLLAELRAANGVGDFTGGNFPKVSQEVSPYLGQMMHKGQLLPAAKIGGHNGVAGHGRFITAGFKIVEGVIAQRGFRFAYAKADKLFNR